MQDLRDFYPEVASVDATSPRGLVRRRPSLAPDAAETRAERRCTSGRVGVVPDLRRFALSSTRGATESEDLVQFTLLQVWEHRTDCPPGTVKSHVSRARDRLAVELGEA